MRLADQSLGSRARQWRCTRRGSAPSRDARLDEAAERRWPGDRQHVAQAGRERHAEVVRVAWTQASLVPQHGQRHPQRFSAEREAKDPQPIALRRQHRWHDGYAVTGLGEREQRVRAAALGDDDGPEASQTAGGIDGGAHDTLLLGESPVFGQGGRTLADWQRDLRHPAVDVRARAAQALVAVDTRAVPALTAALGDKEYRVRANAAEALSKLPPRDVVPGMIEALRSAEVSVRANAAGVLGSFGPAAKPAVPALARALRDPNLRVRELAGEALNRIGSAGGNQPASLPLSCH